MCATRKLGVCTGAAAGVHQGVSAAAVHCAHPKGACVRCCRSCAQASLRALICCECAHALICCACVRVRARTHMLKCARTHTLRACARARSVVSSQAGRDEMVSYEGSRHIIILRGKARRLLCTRMGMRRLRPHPAARLQEMYSLDVLDPSGKLYPEEVPRFVKGPPTFS